MPVSYIDYDIVVVDGKYEIRPFDPKVNWVSERDGGSTIETFLKSAKDWAKGIYLDLENNIMIIIQK